MLVGNLRFKKLYTTKNLQGSVTKLKEQLGKYKLYTTKNLQGSVTFFDTSKLKCMLYTTKNLQGSVTQKNLMLY